MGLHRTKKLAKGTEQKGNQMNGRRYSQITKPTRDYCLEYTRNS